MNEQRGASIIRDVDAFVDGVAAAVGDVAGHDLGRHRPEAVIEASDLVAALIDADGRHGDAELGAYLDGLGPLLEPPLAISTARLRDSDMIRGRSAWLRTPSTMFDLLVRADARNGTRTAQRYYEAAMHLAHAVAAVDAVPSAGEIAAIDAYRSVMLAHLDALGVVRPGATLAATRTPGPAPTAPNAPAAPAAPAPPPAPVARPVEELLGQLDALVGLEPVKAEVRRLTSLLRVETLRTQKGLPVLETSHHLVFTGNPGTGKTTVARLLSQIYHSLGLVSRGHLVEADRSRLVAGFVGQTAARTRQVLESGLGGTVLIDEAYSLAHGGENDFGREAIDTIVAFMEDHRDDLALVAAGYPDEMVEFVDANPGLASRFTRTIAFPDYTTSELVEIFTRLGATHRYAPDHDALCRLRTVVEGEPRGRGFGNARFVRNLFEAAVSRQADRLATCDSPTEAELCTLAADDIGPPPPNRSARSPSANTL